MTETTTIDELSLRVLGADLVDAISDAEVAAVERVPQPTTLDELSSMILKPEVDQSFPEIDLKVEQADFLLHAQDLRLEARLRGVSLAVMLVGLFTAICSGAATVVTLLLGGS